MRMEDTILSLLIKQPFYGYLAASLTPVATPAVPTVRLVSAPAMRLLYNEVWYESLTDMQAMGVVIHELLHLVLLHRYRKGGRERQLWEVACDMAVNEQLNPEMLSAEAVTVEKIAKELRETIAPLNSAEFYYDILSRGDAAVSLVETVDMIHVVLRSGQELKAQKSKEDDTSDILQSAMKSVIAELVDQAEMEGEIPASMAGMIEDLYRDRQVDWRNVLKRFLGGRGRTVSRKSCKKESRRYEGLPGNKRSTGANALLALDESGSISNPQIRRFCAELLNIKRITGADIRVTHFDTECTEPVSLGAYLKDARRMKNGGTDFRPVFQLADRLHIPQLIIFTDGEGIPPQQTNQKVLWVLTKGGRMPAGFGYCVEMDG